MAMMIVAAVMIATMIVSVRRMIVAVAIVQRRLIHGWSIRGCRIHGRPDRRNLLSGHGSKHMTGLQHYKLHSNDTDIITRP